MQFILLLLIFRFPEEASRRGTPKTATKEKGWFEAASV